MTYRHQTLNPGIRSLLPSRHWEVCFSLAQKKPPTSARRRHWPPRPAFLLALMSNLTLDVPQKMQRLVEEPLSKTRLIYLGYLRPPYQLLLDCLFIDSRGRVPGNFAYPHIFSPSRKSYLTCSQHCVHHKRSGLLLPIRATEGALQGFPVALKKPTDFGQNRTCHCTRKSGTVIRQKNQISRFCIVDSGHIERSSMKPQATLFFNLIHNLEYIIYCPRLV